MRAPDLTLRGIGGNFAVSNKETDMYRINENFCIGGADQPYELNPEQTKELLKREMLAGDYDRDDREKIRESDLAGLLEMGRLVGKGIFRIDVTRQGCHQSDIDVSLIA